MSPVEAIRRALASGRVRFTPHARQAIRDEGHDDFAVLDELGIAVRDGEVHRDRNHPRRWVAFGAWLAVVVEIREGVLVVTVFEARMP